MGAPATASQIAVFERARRRGESITSAAAECGLSYEWGKKHDRQTRDPSWSASNRRQANLKQLAITANLGRPLTRAEMAPEAVKALDDFPYFRLRYFGRATLPWQEDMAGKMQELMGTELKEYGVINVTPGAGKTTELHDFAAWVTARNRQVRGFFGSYTKGKSISACHQLRRTLERTSLYYPSEVEMRQGAVPALSTLAGDFGSFRPGNRNERDVWAADRFIVVQDDEDTIYSKEATWTAISYEMDFLGYRFDVGFWDDLVTGESIGTLERIEKSRKWWNETSERRLEPGGAMFLVGQRMGADDLFRHCLDKKAVVDDSLPEYDHLSDEELSELEADAPPMYHHIVYRAHDEEKCENVHRVGVAQPWPAGCLLDPYRVSWREVKGVMQSDPATYAVQMQQEDANPIDVTVRRIWVDGGTEDGVTYIGCWDDRGLWEMPPTMGARYTFVTIDPSPRKFWAIQTWCMVPSEQRLYLLDTIKRKMPTSKVLDYNPLSGQYSGVLVDLVAKAKDVGLPIKNLVFERNGAQEWFFTETHRIQWANANQITVHDHMTGINKLDPQYGVPAIASWFQFGRIRLPAQARTVAGLLVDEVTRHPNAGLDDQVMACWFAVRHAPKISQARSTPVTARVPSYLRSIASPYGRTA